MTVTATNTHPQYVEMSPKWDMLRDSYEGEEAVKKKGVKYLPPTPGQVLDGMNVNGICNESSTGVVSYRNYVMRAVYPDFFTEGVKTLVGILNEKPPKITLPEEMQYLIDEATPDGQNIFTLLRSIHQEQLTTGRLGLLGDMAAVPDQVNPKHYIALYKAEKVLNWDDGEFNGGLDQLNMVLLDESGYKRDSAFTWREQPKYRVLTLGGIAQDTALGEYKFGVSETSTPDDNMPLTTALYKGTPSDKIPFVFIGPNDLSCVPDTPPLLGLARICMTIYRGEADYRYTLFMQAQETLVVVGRARSDINEDGSPKPLRVGAEARIEVDNGGDAKYIGVKSSGLMEQREALKADRELAAVRTGQLLAPGKMSMESGEALKTRVASQTATLTSVANTACAGLQYVLRVIAKWRGLDPKKVLVEPNLEFTNFSLDTQDLVQLMTAKALGFPVSFETMHEIIRERGYTRNTFAEELDRIKADPELLKKIMDANKQNELKGNNPQAGGGGPQPSVKGPNKDPSNKPKD